MLNVASLSDTPGAKLNETVTEGNRPVWLSARGVVLSFAVAIENSGELPAGGCTAAAAWMEINILQTLRSLPVLWGDLENNIVLVELGCR